MTTPAVVTNSTANGVTTSSPSTSTGSVSATTGPGPVQYNIANVAEPQVQSASTTAPASTMVQNAQQAAADQQALRTFFGTGGGYAPQYEVDYSQVPQVGADQNSVSSGAASNPT